MVRRSTPQAKIDRDAWPVVIRIYVPAEKGFSGWGREADPWAWLQAEIGLTEHAWTPHRMAADDAVAIHFRSVEDARRFLDRFPMAVLADGTMRATYSSPHLPFGRQEQDVCNLYSSTTAQEAMRRLFPAAADRLGNLPPLPEIFPDQLAPVIRNAPAGLELAMARWGLPTPPQYLLGKKTDRGVTNVRNAASPHWRPWLGVENRCLVPVTAFAEPLGAGKGNRWFALREDRPAFFAGLTVPRWKSVRKLADGQTTDDLFGFLTTRPNAEVAAIHPKAMPVLLVEPAEWETWLSAPWPEAKALQRPLPDGSLIARPA